VIVKFQDKIIYSKNISSEGYFADQLTINPIGIEDMELAFEFYDINNTIIKNESINILASKKAFELPKLTIEVTPGNNFNEAKKAIIKTKIETIENFKLLGDLSVSYNTHLGWEVGQQAIVSIKNQLDEKIINSENTFTIPENSWIVNASAGVSVQYGKFIFRIHDQKIIYKDNWANEVGRK
jgi:hypothetical protein